jgi:1-acyl-sn-glycerol-3-phosphate acyltransferase
VANHNTILDPLKEPVSFTARARSFVRGTLVVMIGFVTLIIFNLLQILSLALIPFSRQAFRRFNRWCADTWWGWCVVGAERINGTRIVVTGDEVPERENVLLIANHQQMPDIPVIMKLARSKERLGDLKFFVKKQLKWTPGVGWGMQFIDCVFIDRDWASDREHIRRTFARLVDNHVPLWLVSFVEGTRITPHKLGAARAYARETGLPVPEHVLVPRSKGFAASIEGLRGHISAVYDLTIGYVEGVPSLWQYAKGLVGRVHVHVRRYAIEDVPAVESELRAWLLECFAEKDRLLAEFFASGAFPDGAGTGSSGEIAGDACGSSG